MFDRLIYKNLIVSINTFQIIKLVFFTTSKGIKKINFKIIVVLIEGKGSSNTTTTKRKIIIIIKTRNIIRIKIH